jgi:signal transduction histidine kinase
VLVENAVVHTSRGTRVVIRAGVRDGRAALAVEDDGNGVSPEHAAHVFERFYRADDGAQASGSGLGLAIARELAELMGGTLDLESSLGRTVFTVHFP